MVIVPYFSDRTEAAGRSGEARRAGGGSPQGRRPRASPEPPAGAAGTGGAQGRTPRPPPQQRAWANEEKPKQRGKLRRCERRQSRAPHRRSRTPAGGTPAGGKRPQAAARADTAPEPGPRPGRRPGLEAGGAEPQAAGPKGGPARNPRSARAAPARSKAARTGRPQRSKGKAEAQRGQRAPTEREARTRAERRSRGQRPRPGGGKGPSGPQRNAQRRRSRRSPRERQREARGRAAPQRTRAASEAPRRSSGRGVGKEEAAGRQARTPQRVWGRTKQGPKRPGWGPFPTAGPRGPGRSHAAAKMVRRSRIIGAGLMALAMSSAAAAAIWRPLCQRQR